MVKRNISISGYRNEYVNEYVIRFKKNKLQIVNKLVFTKR